jgi:hypothetical protein
VSFNADASLYVGGKYGGTLDLISLDRAVLARTLMGHTHSVRRALFMPDGQTIISIGADSLIKIWDAATGRCLATLTAAGLPTQATLVGGTRLAVGRATGEVDLWDLGFCDAHIAGNAPFFSDLLREDSGKATDADQLRAWAQETFGPEEPEPGRAEPALPDR